MTTHLIDLNIMNYEELEPPSKIRQQLKLDEDEEQLIDQFRQRVADIIHGNDSRLLVIVGPCSIHDERAGLEYATRLAELHRQMNDRLLIVMRAYFEKPRTTLGWKGAINDPDLDGTYNIADGIVFARQFLLKVAHLGLPSATEFLDPFVPQYIGGLVTWGAIGARTAESQTHRQMASGLSMPIGFKNGTGGSIQLAVDGVVAANAEHAFIGIDEAGLVSSVSTTGNPNCHIVLRGGANGPNYDAESVAGAQELLRKSGLSENLVIDCSHANCGKDHTKQPPAFRDVIKQRADGNVGIVGVMLESHLNAGNQPFSTNKDDLEYGVSITDPCIDWQTTQQLLEEAYEALGS